MSILLLKKSIPLISSTTFTKSPFPNPSLLHYNSSSSNTGITTSITTHVSKFSPTKSKSLLILASSYYSDITSDTPEKPPPEFTPPYIHEEPTSIPMEVPDIPSIPEINPVPDPYLPPLGPPPDFPDPGPSIPYPPPVPDIPLPPPDILPPSTPPDITPPPRPPTPGDFPPPLKPPPDIFPPSGPGIGSIFI